jgi:hypothetical protein
LGDSFTLGFVPSFGVNFVAESDDDVCVVGDRFSVSNTCAICMAVEPVCGWVKAFPNDLRTRDFVFFFLFRIVEFRCFPDVNNSIFVNLRVATD